MDDLLELAESDPRRCVDHSQQVIQSDADPATKAYAYRAQGIAMRELGRIEESVASLETARDEYSKLSMDNDADESAISLAASVAMSGNFKTALSMLEPICERSDTKVRSHALVQRAGLIARSGEFDESLLLYEQAEPLLAANEDLRWLALMFGTRGLVQTYRNEFDAAEGDLRSAMQLFETMGRESTAAVMLGNLGFLYVMKGDLAGGLETLLEAHEQYEAWGMPPDPVETAQAFGYMLAGMPDRAYQVLDSAARHLEEQGREVLQAEALIQAARAALAADDVQASLDAIKRARAIESLGDRDGWAAIAELVEADATIASHGKADADALADLSRRFLGWENVTGAAHALALAATVELDNGDPGASQSRLEGMSAIDESLVELPVHVRVDLVRARLAIASGEDESALSQLRDTAELIDRQRILLGAIESRAGLSRLTDDVVALGLGAIRDGSAAVEWVDRFRASLLRMVPVVPNRDPDIARAMAELRRKSKERDEAVASGGGSTELAVDIHELEERIRDLALSRPDAAALTSPMSMPEILAVLGDRLMLYLYERDGRLLVTQVTSTESTTRVAADAARIRALAHHLLSAMRRSFMYPERTKPDRVMAGLDEMAEMLLPLRDETGEVVVVPPPDLIGLPWNAMALTVAPKATAVVAPSADAWARADRRPRRSGKVAVVSGPRLSHGDPEAEVVSQLYSGEVEVLSGDRSTVESVLHSMESSETVHVVAHGHLRQDNPMFSAIELGDGNLNLYNLEEIEIAPTTVILSACDSVHGSVVSGLEMFGLSSVLLSRGSKSVLSTVAPIPDSSASIAAVERIHERLRDGAGPAEALRFAQMTGESGTVDPSLAFVTYGAT